MHSDYRVDNQYVVGTNLLTYQVTASSSNRKAAEASSACVIVHWLNKLWCLVYFFLQHFWTHSNVNDMLSPNIN